MYYITPFSVSETVFSISSLCVASTNRQTRVVEIYAGFLSYAFYFSDETTLMFVQDEKLFLENYLLVFISRE